MKTLLRTVFSSILFFSFSLLAPSHVGGVAAVSASRASMTPLFGFTWIIETIDPHAGLYSQLALDANGDPLIAYQDDDPFNEHDLISAWWNGSTWIKDVVDYLGDTGWVIPSLELDSSGYPHMGYYLCNMYSCSLRYSHWTGSTWKSEDLPVDPGDFGTAAASFTLDSDGFPHFAYCTQERVTMATKLIYAHWTGSEWASERVGDSGCWSSTSIKLDSSDHPGISFYDDDDISLKYAHWTGTEWTVNEVDGSSYAGLRNSLAFDSSDQSHIAYYAYMDGKLKYAEKNGTAWMINEVDTIGGQTGSIDISLALDINGNPHIAYIDAAKSTLKYAARIENEWRVRPVDSGLQSASLRLDSDGLPHISYISGLEVRYARPILQPYNYYIPLMITNP